MPPGPANYVIIRGMEEKCNIAYCAINRTTLVRGYFVVVECPL